ncbi:hypothetical protein [Rhodococcus sp. HNM0569]|uniref:hypothetical protein n=1 Tax=Rhodococcus sp. HNM0569 TaxID=2716340 RepID=UPI00146CD206|nr:hypothetical protein [Rhodococcus sp. HNM0569]NLU83328.1 hypothetical protein [Rhodococcus sp. HNM0569]
MAHHTPTHIVRRTEELRRAVAECCAHVTYATRLAAGTDARGCELTVRPVRSGPDAFTELMRAVQSYPAPTPCGDTDGTRAGADTFEDAHVTPAEALHAADRALLRAIDAVRRAELAATAAVLAAHHQVPRQPGHDTERG